jgi:hypothetical protein
MKEEKSSGEARTEVRWLMKMSIECGGVDDETWWGEKCLLGSLFPQLRAKRNKLLKKVKEI